MIKHLKWNPRARIASLLAVVTIAFGMTAHAAPQESTNDVVALGRYLATASDCIACHTVTGGKPMAGGLRIASPVGTIIASNITPSKAYGIGNYTEQQFADALRKGIRADGANLYPAMPYTAYSVMSDADIHALYTYFMQGVAAVDVATPQTHLPFPMNIRMSMKAWNLLFLNDKPEADDPHQSAQWNRGRYLVDGAAHCSACHTPRGFLMQEEPAKLMGGAQVGAWFAPNITPDAISGIGSWSQAELATYLKTGRLAGKAQAAGSMAEAISHSFQYLTDDDVQAIAVYMRSLPAISDTAPGNGNGNGLPVKSRFDQGQAGNALPAFRGVKGGFEAGMGGNSRGAQIYSSSCASCHGYNGQGSADGYYPSLFNNSATAGTNPNNLIATVLYGVDRDTAKGHVFMPPFGNQTNALNTLSNEDVAALANYVLGQFGNGAKDSAHAVSVKAADVAVIRQGGPQSSLLLLVRIGMGVGALVVVILIALWLRRRAMRASK